MEDIPGIRGGDGGGAGLVGGGGLATGKIAAIVIAIANRACSIGAVVRIGARGDLDFRIAFADKARESVICEGAQAAAILDHTDEIAECVISVGCDVSQATGIFRDLREAAEAVEGALALSASGVGDRHGIVGVENGGGRAVLKGDLGDAIEGVIHSRRVAPSGLAAVGGRRGAARRIVNLVRPAEGVIGDHGIVDALRVGAKLGLRSAAEGVQQNSADDILRRVHFGRGGGAGLTIVGPRNLAAVGKTLLRWAPE